MSRLTTISAGATIPEGDRARGLAPVLAGAIAASSGRDSFTAVPGLHGSDIDAGTAARVWPARVGHALPKHVVASHFDRELGISLPLQFDAPIHGDAALPADDGRGLDVQQPGDRSRAAEVADDVHAAIVRRHLTLSRGIASQLGKAEHVTMLSGPKLGAAIEAARIKKGMTKKALADHFGVKPPSITDWVERGTISKEKLPALWELFADVVGPEHWGLKAYPSATPMTAPEAAPAEAASPDRWRIAADHLAKIFNTRGFHIDPETFLLLVDAAVADIGHEDAERSAAAVFDRLWPLIKRGQKHVNS